MTVMCFISIPPGRLDYSQIADCHMKMPIFTVLIQGNDSGTVI